jgi:hypothetical protein
LEVYQLKITLSPYLDILAGRPSSLSVEGNYENQLKTK